VKWWMWDRKIGILSPKIILFTSLHTQNLITHAVITPSKKKKKRSKTIQQNKKKISKKISKKTIWAHMFDITAQWKKKTLKENNCFLHIFPNSRKAYIYQHFLVKAFIAYYNIAAARRLRILFLFSKITTGFFTFYKSSYSEFYCFCFL
jgi:hypothetical protein